MVGNISPVPGGPDRSSSPEQRGRKRRASSEDRVSELFQSASSDPSREGSPKEVGAQVKRLAVLDKQEAEFFELISKVSSSLSKTEFGEICDYIRENRARHQEEAAKTAGGVVYVRARSDTQARLARAVQFNADGRVYIHLNKGRLSDQILGSGTFKRVRLAFDFDTKEVFAVARTAVAHTEEKEEKSRVMLQRETQLMQECQGMRGIAQVHYVVEVMGRHKVEGVGKVEAPKIFSLQPFYSGGDLFEYIRYGNPSMRARHQIAYDLLYAGAALKTKGIIHRDIKSENVFLEQGKNPDEPSAFLADFGFALKEGEEVKEGSGTPEQLSPEYAIAAYSQRQFLQAVTTDKVDAWALGCTLYELYMEVNVPWVNFGSRKRIISSICELSRSVQPELDFLPDVPVEVQDIIRGLLQCNPRNRLSAEQALDLFKPFARAQGLKSEL